MLEITSKSNSKIKDLVRLRDDSKFRNDKSLFYVEGERIVKDTPIEYIESIFVSKSQVDNFKYICDKVESDKIYVVNDEVFDVIKDTKNSQGIIAIVKYNSINELDKNVIEDVDKCIILDNVNDPGNLGTIIRLAEATNISLIILCNNCCNLYNTKVIRACMSSIFRIKTYTSKNIFSDISILKECGFKIYSTVLDDKSISYDKVDYKNKIVFIFGNEANGICNELINISDEKMYIPMKGSIQSLNVAIASSVICYESMRQNNFYET